MVTFWTAYLVVDATLFVIYAAASARTKGKLANRRNLPNRLSGTMMSGPKPGQERRKHMNAAPLPPAMTEPRTC